MRQKNLIDIIGDLFIYNHESAEHRQKGQHGALSHKAESSFNVALCSFCFVAWLGVAQLEKRYRSLVQVHPGANHSNQAYCFNLSRTDSFLCFLSSFFSHSYTHSDIPSQPSARSSSSSVSIWQAVSACQSYGSRGMFQKLNMMERVKSVWRRWRTAV